MEILKGPLALVTLSLHISSEISFDVVGDKDQHVRQRAVEDGGGGGYKITDHDYILDIITDYGDR